ncbi:hypothetical protein GCM10027295_12630 [Pseudaeromonas pectinilytica]
MTDGGRAGTELAIEALQGGAGKAEAIVKDKSGHEEILVTRRAGPQAQHDAGLMRYKGDPWVRENVKG